MQVKTQTAVVYVESFQNPSSELIIKFIHPWYLKGLPYRLSQ